MSPSVIFVIHGKENGVSFEPIDPASGEAMSIEWNREIFPEIEAIQGHKSVDISDTGRLVIEFADEDELPSDRTVIEEEVELGNELIAKAAGKERADVEFDVCPCLILEVLIATRPTMIAVPMAGYIVDPFAGATLL
jgi:hypothetical protein